MNMPEWSAGLVPAHPATRLFKEKSAAEIQVIAEDIRKHGQREPGVLAKDGGTVFLLDGRARREACKILGIEFQALSIRAGADVCRTLVEANLQTRTLSGAQKAMLGARIIEIGHTSQRDVASELAGAGVWAIGMCLRVLRSGNEDLIRMVDADEISCNNAGRIAAGKMTLADAALDVEQHRTRKIVKALHNDGVRGVDIAEHLGKPRRSVAEIKRRLGVNVVGDRDRLLADIAHAANHLEGTIPQIVRLTAEVTDGLDAKEEEIESCSKRLQRVSRAINKLRTALRSAKRGPS
jgi:ParB-like chromosome segregation protein Spo0J